MNTPSLPRRLFSRRLAVPKRPPLSRLAMPMPSVSGGLRFTEWLLLAVFSLAYLESMSSPVFAIQFHLTSLNHVPLALLGPVLLLHLSGMMMNRPAPPWQAIFGICWPLVCLALYALVGSSVAKWEFKERNSYLTFGIYLVLLPLYAASVPQVAARVRSWALALVAVSVLASLAATGGELVRISARETLHEIEYLVVTGFVLMFYAARSRGVKFIALALMVVAALLNTKLTGYIITMLALLTIGIEAGWRRLLPRWRAAYGMGAVVFVVVFAAALTVLYFEFRQYLPSGNTEVRLKQYEQAWQQFVASPVWGAAYTEGSGEDYRESTRLLNIPTHSDVLDILKHGGLIGLALFAWGYWQIFAVIHRAVAATRGERLLNAYFVGARFFLVTALVTFSFNPLLLKGPFLIVIWGSLGLAIGMALAVTRPAAAVRRA